MGVRLELPAALSAHLSLEAAEVPFPWIHRLKVAWWAALGLDWVLEKSDPEKPRVVLGEVNSPDPEGLTVVYAAALGVVAQHPAPPAWTDDVTAYGLRCWDAFEGGGITRAAINEHGSALLGQLIDRIPTAAEVSAAADPFSPDDSEPSSVEKDGAP